MAMSYCWVLFSAGLFSGSAALWARPIAAQAIWPFRQADDFLGHAASAADRHIGFRPIGAPALGVTGAAASSVFVGAIMVSALLVEFLRGQRAISLRMHQRAGDGHWPQTFSKWRVLPA